MKYFNFEKSIFSFIIIYKNSQNNLVEKIISGQVNPDSINSAWKDVIKIHKIPEKNIVELYGLSPIYHKASEEKSEDPKVA